MNKRNIGLIDVDGTGNFPDLALMKLSAWHKKNGDEVEWYTIFGDYDIVYMSKVFTHTPDFGEIITNAKEIRRGGTGYDLTTRLPPEAEKIIPDYSLYPFIDKKSAYGFLTRGCVRKCPWCIVPKKEGRICKYQDVEEIAVNGRTRLVLMDNNILAAGDYALEQFDKIIRRRFAVDFNQALDARLVDDVFADKMAKMRWIKYIRFGCDTNAQIAECERAISMLRDRGYTGKFFLYTILQGDIRECYDRVAHFRRKGDNKVTPFAQPYLDFSRKTQNIPEWQRDMARWANRKEIYETTDFVDFEPRKGFKCGEYFY